MAKLPSFRSAFGAPLLTLAALLSLVGSAAAQTPPGTPVGLSAVVNGSGARITWSPPNGGPTVSAYALDAGTSSGSSNLVSNYVVGNVLALDTPPLAPGSYFVRVRATNTFGSSTPSTEVSFSVGGAPGPPINLAASVTGSRLTLTWGAPTTGSVPTNYLVTAGRTPLSRDIVDGAPIGPNVGFATDVPPGIYHIRLQARNGVGTSGYSNEVVVTVGGSGPPGPPTNFDYTVLGRDVQLRWTPSGNGGTPTSYVLQVGSQSGLQNVLVQDVGNVTTMNVAAPVDGSFYVRVLARNQFGVSGPSNERVITLYPSACARGAFVATLVWDTGSVGQQRVDMDLHVIEPGNQMVYYGNRIGLTTQLDRDNTQGLGPENICSRTVDALGNPIQPSAGTYQVYARSYSGNQWPTTARITVRSWVGTPQETFRVIERVFTGPVISQNFATVTYPAGTITEVSGTRVAQPLTSEDPDVAPPKALDPKQ